MLRLLSAIGRAVALLALVSLLPFDVALAQASGGDPFSNLLAYGGAFLTSALLGGAKRLDTQITNAPLFRKLQPFITLGGAFLAPLIASKVGLNVDPSAFTAAPIATVVTIGAAELLSLITKRKG